MCCEITLEITKLVNGGQGLGFYDGKPVFVWNALPDETAIVKLTKKKKNFLEGIAVEIKNASPERIEPKENHFISCSPWQIMKFESENHWKREIAKETFKKIGGIDFPGLKIVYVQKIFGYRNKIEYKFIEENGDLKFAFNKRSSNKLIPINECLLAKANINAAAKEMLDKLNGEKIESRNLKSLILRENDEGKVIASLIVNNEGLPVSSLNIDDTVLSGFHIYSNSSGLFKQLFSLGNTYITEEFNGMKFKCGSLSFFQVNTEVFEKTLSRIKTFIENEEEIIDFYSGVGTIGISLKDKVKRAVLIESDKDSSAMAEKNIELNNCKNFTAYNGSSESWLSKIKENRTIIFNPPRAGLKKEVVDTLLDVLPPKIIYLSCDVATMARDIKRLSLKYRIRFCELYNYFPRTPHIETLIVLEKKHLLSF